MNNMPREVSKAVMVVAALLCAAAPAAACGPNLGPVGTALLIAVLLAFKIAPLLFALLVVGLMSKVWTWATRSEPLRGQVTVLRPLGL